MNKNIKKVNLTSSDLSAEKQAELQRILPEVFSENKINWEKLRTVLGDKLDDRMEKFNFTWSGKSQAIKNVLVSSKLTLKPSQKESIKWDESENLFIEGDNLEVLKLLQKTYFEKVKLIYIDPPYNTGGDFVYHDDFASPLNSYLEQTGQKGDGMSLSTNKETSGRYHSDWLSMMYPRLKLAWNLLREDGVIFISIDDNEYHRLRMMMDEIFGEENFVATIVWQKKYSPQNDATYFSDMHDFIVCFAKKKKNTANDLIGWSRVLLPRTEEQNARYSNPDNDPRGDWKSSDMSVKTYSEKYDFEIITPTGRKVKPPRGRCWRFGKEKYQEMLADNRVWFGSEGTSIPSIKRFLTEVQQGIVPSTLWLRDEVGDNEEAAKEIRTIFEYPPFDTPKPTRLINRIIELSTCSNSNDIILDFFAGSATTAHSVLLKNLQDNGNRKFILVQLPEVIQKESVIKATGLKTVSQAAIERVRKVIKILGDCNGVKVFKLAKSNYVENNFELDSSKSENENAKAFQAYLNKAKQQGLFGETNDLDVVYENVVKEGLSLNSKVTKEKIGKSEAYKVVDGARELLICLDKKIAVDTAKLLSDKALKGKTFICLDSALDDSSKANLALNLELKTI